MTLRTTKDCVCRQGFLVPSGSCITDAKKIKRSYRGTWASMFGTHTVTIPISATKP